jgi:hypothetical protein
MAKVENSESKKTKKERKIKEAKTTFPAKGFINAYLFIRLPAKVAEAFGAEKGKKTDISIDLQDNALIVRKA